MSDPTPTVHTLIEDVRLSDGREVRWSSKPDYRQTVPMGFAEFIAEAGTVLAKFRADWQEKHAGSWLEEIELDIVPVMTSGMLSGFMVLSEIDVASYDYAPAEQETTNLKKEDDQ